MMDEENIRWMIIGNKRRILQRQIYYSTLYFP